MKVLIAIDSFKGSISSMEAGNSAARGIKRVYPDAAISVRPLADGGEGTVEALTIGCGGELCEATVTGPLGAPVRCQYSMNKSTKTAIIEMSGAAGLTLISEKDRNPFYTTTYGVGEVIAEAIAKGCRNFLVGIGGSATNDGGIGMLQALGFEMLNSNGIPVKPGALGLAELAVIKEEHALPALKECKFKVICDVTNPLCGKQGSSAVYGPQKGADPYMIMQMDKWLADYAGLAGQHHPDADPDRAGAGAAGGLGFAFMTFLNASLESGIKVVLEETRLRDYVKDADIVITGEGRLDNQTVMGKAPAGVAAIAKEYGKTVLAFSGCVAKGAEACNENGIDAFFPILRGVTGLEDAMHIENAMANMEDTVEQVFRLIKSISPNGL